MHIYLYTYIYLYSVAGVRLLDYFRASRCVCPNTAPACPYKMCCVICPRTVTLDWMEGLGVCVECLAIAPVSWAVLDTLWVFRF